MSPVESATQPARLARTGIGKPILLLAILCAFLTPLSNPVAGSAISDVSINVHVAEPADSLLHGAFIQQQIVHIATHPKTDVPFLTAFLTEAERLCQPHAHQSPEIPCPNAISTLLIEASSIVLPASWLPSWHSNSREIGMASLGWSDSQAFPPDPPPPKTSGEAI